MIPRDLPYRFYPLDRAGRLRPSQEMACPDDAAALAAASSFLRDFPAVEVWNGARLVGRRPG